MAPPIVCFGASGSARGFTTYGRNFFWTDDDKIYSQSKASPAPN
jgi:hypothetical protein